MSLPPALSSFPPSFPSHSGDSARRYVFRPDCFACLNADSGVNERALYSLHAENLAVYAGSPPEREGFAQFAPRPVYATSDDEPPAVPTGRVFVQSAGKVDLNGLVASVGYTVESVPSYAPHAAWLVAQDGEIATALRNLDNLIALDGIESVEPQMLRPAARRG